MAHLEPSVELTGGPWYTDNELDTEFIKLLCSACLRYIRERVCGVYFVFLWANLTASRHSRNTSMTTTGRLLNPCTLLLLALPTRTPKKSCPF